MLKKGVEPIYLLITWLCRIIFGSVFIFSGFVKAVDPWGTYYKVNEYLEAMGMHFVPGLVLTFAFALFSLEFLIGVFILLGCYRRGAPVMGTIFMAIMLPLTLWIAIKDPVPDCGCFGDALILSNWATFWKNMALTAMIIWLLKFDKKTYALVGPALQWVLFIVSIGFILMISIRGYVRQPMFDFRPYPVGSELVSEANEEDGPHYVFVYAKDGAAKEFGEDDELPDEDDGWEFIERKEIPDNSTADKDKKLNKNFRIWDKSGSQDLTDILLAMDNKLLLMTMPDLASVSPATTWKINSLYDLAIENDVRMIGVVSGSSEIIKEWEDLSMPQYDIFIADDTSIKEVVRGNPGVVYVEDNEIKWKSTLDALDIEALADKKTRTNEVEVMNSGPYRANVWISMYVIITVMLIALSLLPKLCNVYTSRRANRLHITDDDMVHPLE
ncbi:MAG: DoxX family protein [Muribaculaceae bacterium]|nr:DoxX family protein [Muribaculaceae bacterium]